MNTNQPRGRNKAIPAVSITRRYGKGIAVLSLLLLTACGNGQAASSSVIATKAAAASAAPAPIELALTPCAIADEQTAQAGDTFICTEDGQGQLVWLEASASKAITDKRAADVAATAAAAKAAAKAAAEKAAAKAAAEKAAAEKAAAEKAAKLAAQQAAAKKAADAASAAEAAQRAAEAKAAQEAAAARAATDQAAQQALVAPPAAAAPAPSNCDPNYSGACVPIASDVDCAGGNGNGPAYVQGPVTVTGSDIYRLDSNSDGVGCEG